MTTYTDEVNIYNPDAIGDAIDDAGNAYKTYITEVTSDGIMVAAAGKGTSNGSIVSTTTGWHLSDVLEWVRNGVSRFWIGLKNDGDTTPTVRIGKAYVSGASDNESHMELDFHSLKLIDAEGDTYFHVADLRDGNGRITDTWEADGTTRKFTLTVPSGQSNYAVYVDDVEITSGVTRYMSGYFVFDTAPSAGSIVKTKYIPFTYAETKSFTFGYRDSSTRRLGCLSFAIGDSVAASGDYAFAAGSQTSAQGTSSHAEGQSTQAQGQGSHAEGYNTRAIAYASHAEGYYARAAGFYSHAQNEGAYTGRWAQTAIGTYNVKDWDDPDAVEPSPPTTHPSGIDAYGQYALIIGNGTADNARSNALAIDWDGGVDLWTPHIDMTTTPSSNVYDRMLEVFDKNGNPIGWFQVSQGTNGSHAVVIGASNSDDSVHNQLHLSFDANDDPTAWISHPVPFRNALGASSGIWPVSLGGTGLSSHSNDNNAASAVNVATSTWTQLATISLTAGRYAVIVGGYAASNATGRRGWSFTTDAASSHSAARMETHMIPAVSGALYQQLVYFPAPTATTTYRVHGWQNSGAALSMSAYIRAIPLWS